MRKSVQAILFMVLFSGGCTTTRYSAAWFESGDPRDGCKIVVPEDVVNTVVSGFKRKGVSEKTCSLIADGMQKMRIMLFAQETWKPLQAESTYEVTFGNAGIKMYNVGEKTKIQYTLDGVRLTDVDYGFALARQKYTKLDNGYRYDFQIQVRAKTGGKTVLCEIPAHGIRRLASLKSPDESRIISASFCRPKFRSAM